MSKGYEDITLETAATDEGARFVCGYPKTGRTWLRFMLANALNDTYGLGLDVDLSNAYSVVPNESVEQMKGQPDFAYTGVAPKVQMSHRKYDAERYESADLAFLTRDPRDVMVSHWMHDKNQVHLFSGSLSEYVHSPGHGIVRFLDHLETWAPHLGPDQVITYETMRTNTVETLGRIGGNIAIPFSEATLSVAALKGQIDRMRGIEITNGIAGQHYDRSNPDARRVRIGKIGGFTEHLQEGDITYIHDAVMDASPEVQAIIGLTPYFEQAP